MKQLIKAAAVALAATGLIAATGAIADEGHDLLKSKGCLGCHDFEKKKVGPAFKDVAVKEKGKEKEMVAKVYGAKGHPKVKATEEEVSKAVAAALTGKP